ncbi:hypothetical protein FLA_2161 [Filimonas lacunae]|nr:hypothetical protein FLA_2161 [Filimonas lacunae]
MIPYVITNHYTTKAYKASPAKAGFEALPDSHFPISTV